MEYCDRAFSFFEWTTDRGLRLRGAVHGSERPDSPCIIFSHGLTGNRMGPGYLFVKISRALAAEGFSSVRFDFCGSGESEGFFGDMNTDTMTDDLLTVVKEVRKRAPAPERLILLGHSFGGMIAARCAAPAGAQGIILLSPVADLRELVQRKKELLGNGPNLRGFYELGPHEISASFLGGMHGTDPVYEFTRSYKGKMLLIHGDRDPSVPVDESYRYVSAAQSASIDAEFCLINGADHNYSRPADVETVIEKILIWTKEHFCD